MLKPTAMTADAFYLPDGPLFVATHHTRGPWSPQHQHGGPPAALLARAIERVTDLHVVRVTVELLRPVPIAALSVQAEVVRAGKKVQLCEATLSEGETVVCRARGLAVRRTQLDLGRLPEPSAPDLPPPDACRETAFPFFIAPQGYHTANEQRFARGDWGLREASMWMRPRVPLVAGETMSPLQRVVNVADCNNGITNILDTRRFVYINPDLTVHLFRPPVGEWVCLHAATYPQPHGYGMAESLLLDEQGPIGRSVQSLFVDRVGDRDPEPATGA